MRFFQAHGRTRIVSGPQVQAQPYELFEDTVMRRESTAVLGVRTAPADPYAAWLQQREAERERHQEVRWVHRYRAR
jgi:hypothetical protein